MRSLAAAACCVLALLLVALPVRVSAIDATTQAATRDSGRELLVVNENVNANLTTSTNIATKGGSTKPVPISGAVISSVGEGFVPPEQPNANTTVVSMVGAADAGSSASGEKGTKRAAKQQARRARKQRQRQQPRPLGRKGGPALRQSAPRQAAAGASADAGGPTPAQAAVGSLDDYILPFCQPRAGVVCSDRDKSALLKAQPAVISLENAYPYAQVKPAVSYAGSSATTLDFGSDTYSNRNQGVTKAALETLAGTEAVNSDTTVTTTALQTTLDASRRDRVIPDSFSVVADRTAAEGTYQWKSWRPRFTYQIGANYGLPVGLATVADTSGK